MAADPTGGTVTFYDGSTSLGTEQVSASGRATLTITTLSVGTHPITATFNPADNSYLDPIKTMQAATAPSADKAS